MMQQQVGSFGAVRTVGLVLASLALGLGACKAWSKQQQTLAPATPILELPPNTAPAPELLPLAFMAGRWVSVNPNKTVNEEHWSSPRGNHMVALYRQIRRDGKPALVEVSLVTAEKPAAGSEGQPTKVMLRLRHLHANLEVPENRRELSLFELKQAGDNRAEFVGVGDAAQVTSVVYRLTGPDTLAVDVNFAPDSKEKGFTMNYTREAFSRQASAVIQEPAK
jgi:hypothetical protein